jgi:dienelactone hydrolase
VTGRREIEVPAGEVSLPGILRLPKSPRGVTLFAHGTGSGRHSPRNNAVAEVLDEAGIATLLVDLLTEEEEEEDLRTGHLRFDIGFLAERLLSATAWLGAEPETAELPVAYFGASTGAGAALVAAASGAPPVAAIVSRGGRPDLAGDVLPRVQAPTLLIVGSLDAPVIDMNREAMARMRAEVRLEIVEGASHLFEEPGTLEEVSRLARDFLLEHLPG